MLHQMQLYRDGIIAIKRAYRQNSFRQVRAECAAAQEKSENEDKDCDVNDDKRD